MATRSLAIPLLLAISLGSAILDSTRLTAGEKRLSSDKDGFVPLFDDSSTRMIVGEKANSWAFNDDGTIVSRGPGASWLLTKKEYANFDLRLEIRMSEGGDTGITFRSSRDVAATPSITQIQFIDEAVYEELGARYRTGALWDVVQPLKENVTKPIGEWNEIQVIAKGGHLSAKINDHLVLDVDLSNYKHRTKGKNGGLFVHPDLLRPKGHIGLESWAGRVEFRNVRIKELE